MGFLSGKKLLVTVVLPNRSIACGIAKACHTQGAELVSGVSAEITCVDGGISKNTHIVI